MKQLNERRVQLIGHVLRNDESVERAMEGKVEGKRCRGRSRLEYVRQITEDVNCGSCCQLKRKAEKRRQEWRVAANQFNGC